MKSWGFFLYCIFALSWNDAFRFNRLHRRELVRPTQLAATPDKCYVLIACLDVSR